MFNTHSNKFMLVCVICFACMVLQQLTTHHQTLPSHIGLKSKSCPQPPLLTNTCKPHLNNFLWIYVQLCEHYVTTPTLSPNIKKIFMITFLKNHNELHLWLNITTILTWTTFFLIECLVIKSLMISDQWLIIWP
jgi:hypothetical protein